MPNHRAPRHVTGGIRGPDGPHAHTEHEPPAVAFNAKGRDLDDEADALTRRVGPQVTTPLTPPVPTSGAIQVPAPGERRRSQMGGGQCLDLARRDRRALQANITLYGCSDLDDHQ